MRASYTLRVVRCELNWCNIAQLVSGMTIAQVCRLFRSYSIELSNGLMREEIAISQSLAFGMTVYNWTFLVSRITLRETVRYRDLLHLIWPSMTEQTAASLLGWITTRETLRYRIKYDHLLTERLGASLLSRAGNPPNSQLHAQIKLFWFYAN